LISPLLPIKKR